MKIISTISSLVLLFTFSLIPTSAQIYNEDIAGQGEVSSVKAQCDPSDDQIALYEDENFGGQCVIKSVGAYANPESIGLPNDSITSLRVGANVSVTLYQDNEFAGVDESFTADDANLGDNTIGNDQVSSVKVECDPSDDQIALYENENFGGQCVVKPVGAYANPESIGLPNDSITSLRVGANVSVTLYQDNEFAGVNESFTADDANLGDNTIGNDQVSSVKVECDPSDDQIALYENENFGGQCVVKPVGAYANPESIGLPNDSITSLRVGANVSTTLCRDNDFGGVCESFTADDANLGDNTIGNDTVSSASVTQSGVIYLPLVQTK